MKSVALGRATVFSASLLLVALVAACDSSTPDPLSVGVSDGTMGNYGGPCKPDGNCNEGFVCVHHVCKEAAD